MTNEDGVYRRTEGRPVIQEGRAPTTGELQGLLAKIITRHSHERQSGLEICRYGPVHGPNHSRKAPSLERGPHAIDSLVAR